MEKVTRKVTVEIDYYIATDGKEFDNELDCENYEDELEQIEKESLADKIKCEVNQFDWPSMTNPFSNHEYNWFRVENDEDLKIFCEAYSAYSRDLKDIEFVKKHVTYPDYICLVDYPKGPEHPDWFVLSKIMVQANLFLSQFPLDKKGNLI